MKRRSQRRIFEAEQLLFLLGECDLLFVIVRTILPSTLELGLHPWGTLGGHHWGCVARGHDYIAPSLPDPGPQAESPGIRGQSWWACGCPPGVCEHGCPGVIIWPHQKTYKVALSLMNEAKLSVFVLFPYKLLFHSRWPCSYISRVVVLVR